MFKLTRTPSTERGTFFRPEAISREVLLREARVLASSGSFHNLELCACKLWDLECHGIRIVERTESLFAKEHMYNLSISERFGTAVKQSN